MELCQVPDKAREADVIRLMEQHGDGLLRFCYLNLGDLHHFFERSRGTT